MILDLVRILELANAAVRAQPNRATQSVAATTQEAAADLLAASILCAKQGGVTREFFLESAALHWEDPNAN